MLARAARLAAVLALLAGRVDATDLLPSLRAADVCDARGCVAAAPEAGAPVVITAAARRELLVRLPVGAPRLAVDAGGADAVLAVIAAADGARPQEILRRPVRGATSARVDLAPLAGRVVRLAFGVEGTGEVALRELTLVDERPTPSVSAPPARPWNVVVYVIDTLRADYVGAYGSRLGATPRIDAFAASAVRFSHAVAQSSWTLPSIATMLTGLLPPRHGAIGPAHGIRGDAPMLPELLARSGYTTAAFVTNYLGSGAFGLDRGFGTFRFYRERGATRRKVYLRSDALHRRIVHWLDRRPPSPFFLWVHATDPHFPYLPPPRHTRFRAASPTARAEVERLVDEVRPLHNGNEAWGARPTPLPPDVVNLLRDLYSGEVRAADQWFGRLLDVLAARDLLEHTIVVLTSDHGEEFLEHGGLAHGQTLHRELLDVPLLARLPGGASGGAAVDGIARHVDLLPTILGLAGIPAPTGLDGVPLLGPGASMPDEAYAALHLGRFDQDAVVTTEWKLMRNLHGPRLQLFDLVHDPAERVDVAATGALCVRYGAARLDALAAAQQPGPRVHGDRIERLRALGYLEE